MQRYLLRKLLLLVPILLLVTVVDFVLLRLAPGDPAELSVSPLSPPEVIAAERQKLGLDRPLHVQYEMFLAQVAHGDLGKSVLTAQSTVELIRQRGANTLVLGLASLALTYLFALPAGVLAALRSGTYVDQLATSLAQLGLAVPNFLLALLLVLLFALKLGWFPVSGFGDIRHVVLPAVALAAEGTALSTRMVRSAVLEVLHQDYVRTARAKGLHESRVVVRHVVRNALVPVISVLGLRISVLIGGAVIVETIFGWPGIGRLLVDSTLHRDYPVLQGVVLVLAGLIVLVNLFTDLLYALADPKIRY